MHADILYILHLLDNFFFQAEDGIRDKLVTGVQTCALPIFAIVAIDGPGQGEAEYEIPICGDYERAARAVCDWIEKRADLDAAKIAMWGVSLGGYYAPRATAYERRIRACIALSGPFEWKEIWGALPVLTREAFRVRSHCATEAEALSHAATLSMNEAAAKIACPIFIVTGREDRLVPASHAERLAKSVSGPVELLIVENGGDPGPQRTPPPSKPGPPPAFPAGSVAPVVKAD